MQKSTLQSFIGKYHLNGACNSVKWSVADKTLTIDFLTESRICLGKCVVPNVDLPDSEIGIHDTGSLKKMISSLSENIELRLVAERQKNTSLTLIDEDFEAKFMLAELSVIPETTKLKMEPPVHISMDVDKLFISKYTRAYSALSNVDTVAFKSSEGEVDVIVNYSEINSNKMQFTTSAKITEPIDLILFNAEILNDILTVNKDCESGEITLFDKDKAGIIVLSFVNKDGVQTKYYVNKLPQQ